ncbi:MAG: 2-amino-4-hydroxy-6-hydroxymethyldihydropteridine diphosphokinase [Gemmatimonadota bacterium]
MPGEPACFNLTMEAVATVYLGLGTNLGERARNLTEALERIGRLARIDAVSSVYESEPVGYTEQPEFWNLVARITTDLPARQLMHELIAIEQAMGRERSFRNAPRLIDIDNLLFDDVVTADADVEIPHPRMAERAFVLEPLLELAPGMTEPRTGRRYADILGSKSLERAVVVAPPIRVSP